VGDPELWTTLVDPNQLENVLLNLVINARDAMPGGGRLIIRTDNQQIEGEMALTCDLAPGSYVCLSVTDTGTGMTPDIIARVFDPFYTTKPIGQGTGLGLSMIYGFVQQSGGRIQIRSAPGEGTTMSLYLPRDRPAGHTVPPVIPAAASVPSAQPTTILVVDDEPNIRMLVAEVLRGRGFAVIEAGEAASALIKLRSSAQIDLLVTDVGLPGGMNGRQLAEIARVLRPDMKVLFVTGYAETALVADRTMPPGMEILAKPFRMLELAGRINRLIGQDAGALGMATQSFG
jgi:CheY-like chemotaxis protein